MKSFLKPKYQTQESDQKSFLKPKYQNYDSDEKHQRSTRLSNTSLVLTKTNPLERLREFCHQGNYFFKHSWDKFTNGIMCECEVYYKLSSSRKTLIHKSRFVPSVDLDFAKNQLAALILVELGLSVEERETEKQNPIQSFLETGMNLIKESLTENEFNGQSKRWADL